MAETITDRPINPFQLDQEMAGGAELRVAERSDGTRRVRSVKSQAALDKAVAAHKANPAIVAPPSPEETQDAADETFVASRLDGLVAKARAIVANPGTAPDFTAAEQKVIRALAVLDLARRRRR